ncbi:DUF885 domain-containing protein [Sphingomonas sp. UYP23]
MTGNEMNRRTVLVGAAGTALLSGLGPAEAAKQPLDNAAFAAAFVENMLVLRPDLATLIGADIGRHRGLKSRMPDVSMIGLDRLADLAQTTRQSLAHTASATSAPGYLCSASIEYACERALEGEAFGYGGGAQDGFEGAATPYVVTHQQGVISNYPEFLNSQHQIANVSDAEAYLARVAAIPAMLDGETARIRRDAARGVFPPFFVATQALDMMRSFRSTPALQQGMTTSLQSRAAKGSIPGDWAARCSAIVNGQIYPALDRQIDAYSKGTATAGSGAGVAGLPDGEAYYRWAVRLGTTTVKTPSEIHELGLSLSGQLRGKVDSALKSQGLTTGSVAARLAALNGDPRFLFADNDDGRIKLIAYLRGRIAALRVVMPKISHLNLKADIDVERVPIDIQDGAPLGSMNSAPRDGARPAVYYVNLRRTKLWPRYQLPTLTAHEGIPGHTWQGAYLAETTGVSPVTMLLNFNAFNEGWALYAEQLVDEVGFYADDPFGRIGYLQAQQLRACRLVVDTGLHAMGWSRAKAVSYLIEQTGKGVEAVTSEADHYCVAPGQACGYMVGLVEIRRLRKRAVALLGEHFDLANFNDAIVRTGGVPLALLDPAIMRWSKTSAV